MGKDVAVPGRYDYLRAGNYGLGIRGVLDPRDLRLAAEEFHRVYGSPTIARTVSRPEQICRRLPSSSGARVEAGSRISL